VGIIPFGLVRDPFCTHHDFGIDAQISMFLVFLGAVCRVIINMWLILDRIQCLWEVTGEGRPEEPEALLRSKASELRLPGSHGKKSAPNWAVPSAALNEAHLRARSTGATAAGVVPSHFGSRAQPPEPF